MFPLNYFPDSYYPNRYWPHFQLWTIPVIDQNIIVTPPTTIQVLPIPIINNIITVTASTIILSTAILTIPTINHSITVINTGLDQVIVSTVINNNITLKDLDLNFSSKAKRSKDVYRTRNQRRNVNVAASKSNSKVVWHLTGKE